MTYYAHTKDKPDGTPAPESEWQPLAEHLTSVASLAADFARPLGLMEEARLAGHPARMVETFWRRTA